jgi:hypothetical protein
VLSGVAEMVIALKASELINSVYCSLYCNSKPHTTLFIVTDLTFVTIMTWIHIVVIKKTEE